MKTISIIGTDWSGADPAWRRQPFHSLDRRKIEDWQNVFYELGDVARVDSIAVGIRGAYDTGSVESLPIALSAYQSATYKPTLMPWFDTVGLPDIAGPPHTEHKFDFANSQHIEWGWDRYARVFFDIFKDAPLERSTNDRVLIAWWGIDKVNHYGGFTNQRYAQRLLDLVDRKLIALGLGAADHIVDTTWLQLCPSLRVYGVHDWFDAWSTPPKPYSIRQHNGVTVGVTVPSFYDIINPDGNADTLREALAAMRQANVDYVLLESGTNFVEAAELMRDSTGDTSKLDAVREHIALTRNEPPIEEDDLMALTATFSLRRSERKPHPSRPGYYTSPFPGKPDKVLSVESPAGNIAERPAGTTGPWESWREEGNRAVFDDVHGYTFAIPLVD
jgi:hypothetical protein